MSKYEVLRVSRSASFQEVKRAYQAAALLTHPDKQAASASDVLKKEVRLIYMMLRSTQDRVRVGVLIVQLQ